MKIKRSKSGVILIDEFEKGDSAVWSFFLDLLENGKFTDSQGEEHDLNGYTIVFTSNTPRTEVQNKFPPELLSRFNLDDGATTCRSRTGASPSGSSKP